MKLYSYHLELLIVLEVHKVNSGHVVLILYHGEVRLLIVRLKADLQAFTMVGFSVE